MNKQEADRTFIKENLNFLTSLDVEKKLLRARVRAFYTEKHKKKFGFPNTSEICEQLVRYQAKSGVPATTISDQLEVLPIFKNLGASKIAAIQRLINTE